MAIDLGRVEINRDASGEKEMRRRMVQDRIIEAGSMSIKPSKLALEPAAPEKAKASFLQQLGRAMSIGAMSYAEGMGAGKPYSNYVAQQNAMAERDTANAKAQEDLRRWQEEIGLKKQENVRQDKELALKEAESPLKGLVKKASDIDILVRAGLMKADDAKVLLRQMSEMEGTAEGIKAQAKADVTSTASAVKNAAITGNYYSDLDIAYDELKSNAPKSTESKGVVGMLSRGIEVPLKGAEGTIPYTTAVIDQMGDKVMARAKEADPSGRISDKDYLAFAKSFGKLGEEAPKNVVAKAVLNLQNIKRKADRSGLDGSKLVNELFLNDAADGGEFTKMIYNEYYDKFPDLEKGTIENGYEYIGGNKALESSWRKAK